LGIPTLEDKIVQAGLVKILQAIYEQDFIKDSYGFRPNRGCHDALRALNDTVENKSIHYMVEADIKGFFDNVNQDQLMTFLAHRIADKRILRYIKRFLISGIQEDGQTKASEKGTPQGGVISPILANIYLHYVLDIWFERKVKRQNQSYSRLIRYADDYVVCFQSKQDAKAFMPAMIQRLKDFHLEVAPEKTKLFAFGVFAQSQAKVKGDRCATFDFLGFTHYCSRTKNGRCFKMKRKTVSKRLKAKVKGYKEWLKASRTLPTAQILQSTARKLRGHYAYYGVTDNAKSIATYAYLINQLLFKWLNRRGKRGCYTWEKFHKLLAKFPLPQPRIRVKLYY
jgi:group II intron reverse transcriptase/maturase